MPPDDPGSLLVRAGLIGEEQLMLARKAQDQSGGTLGEYLVLGGFVDDDELTEVYSKKLLVPRIDPQQMARIPPQVLRKIPADMAAEFRVVPIASDGEQNLTLAMSDPSDQHAAEEVGFFSGSYVVRAVATQLQIAWCLAHYYGVVTPLAQARLLGGEPAGGGEDDDPDTDGEPAAPVLMIEAETGPSRVERLPRLHGASPEELAPRSGELSAMPDPRPEPQKLPAVVIEDDPPAPGDSGDVPILLEHRKGQGDGDGAGPGAGSGEVVLLEAVKTRRRRTSRQTQPGIGPLGSVDSRRQPVHDTEVSLAPPAWDHAGEDQEPGDDDAVSGSKKRKQSKATRSAEETRPVPRRAAPPSRPPLDNVDEGWEVDGWGPPGTTIPPAYLGAVPSSLSEPMDSNSIPLPVGDELTSETLAAENAPLPEVPVAVATEATLPAPAPAIDPAELAAAMEQSSNRLLETVRTLERAPGRDQIIDALLDHLGHVVKRRGFFAVKGGVLFPFRQQGAARPGVGEAELPLDQPSTFGEVALGRLPFRGALSPAAVEFVERTLGSRPPAGDSVVIPVVVRGRAVGLLYGDGVSGLVFDEHQMLLGRAAGQALERILKAAKSA